MVTIKRIGVFSAAAMLGGVYALFGLILGGIVTVMSLVGSTMGGQGGIRSLLFGMGAVVVLPVIYGLAGFIGGSISACIYNVVAGAFGGIDVELEGAIDAGQRPSRVSRG